NCISSPSLPQFLRHQLYIPTSVSLPTNLISPYHLFPYKYPHHISIKVYVYVVVSLSNSAPQGELYDISEPTIIYDSTNHPRIMANSTNTPKESNDEVKIVGARNGSYTKEDLFLISAWLNTGQEPIDGNGKKISTFWERIWWYYHELKDCDSHRNANSLMHRWSQIQLMTNKFL
ncbi:hypothetical protein GIB67_028981, partial [Kingdonia uniflora]